MADLTIGIVGLGSIGQRHIKNVLKLCGENGLSCYVAALRHRPSTLPPAIASLVNREVYSYADMPCCDIVLICNPSQTHLETVHKLKNKAAKIFLEKPAFIKPITECELSDLDPLGDKIRVACPLRHSRTYEELSAYVKANEIYSARAICSSYLQQWRTGADYSKLYSAREDSGGVKIDLIHEFDYMFRLFGFPSEAVLLEGKVSNLSIKCSDVALYSGFYPKMAAEIHLDYFGRRSQRQCEIYSRNEVRTFDFLAENENVNMWYVREMADFLNFAMNGSENINSLKFVNDVLKGIYRARKAMEVV